MSDITKCSGEGCPIKEKCYRFTAKSDVYQSIFLEVPGKWEDYLELNADGSLTDTQQWVCDMYYNNLCQDQEKRPEDIG